MEKQKIKKRRKTLRERYAEAKQRELNCKEKLKQVNEIVEQWIVDDCTTDKMILTILKLTED